MREFFVLYRMVRRTKRAVLILGYFEPCNFPSDCSMPGFPVYHQLPELTQTFESVMPSNHLILCHPRLLLPSVFPSIRVFSNESILRIR